MNKEMFLDLILKCYDPFEIDEDKVLKLEEECGILQDSWLTKVRIAIELVSTDKEYTGDDEEIQEFVEELLAIIEESYKEIASIPHDKLF